MMWVNNRPAAPGGESQAVESGPVGRLSLTPCHWTGLAQDLAQRNPPAGRRVPAQPAAIRL